MITAARVACVLGQVLGTAALLLGLFVLAGLSWTLLAGGALLLAACTLMEARLLARPAAPPARRSGVNIVRGA